MRKINVCIIGAGGTMGYKTSRNLLRKQNKYELSVCEIDPDAIGKLEKIGLHVTDMDAAVPNADVVVPAINDSGLKALAPKVLACMKPGAAMVILDPASVINGEIPQRNDCTLAICHPCHPSFFLDQDTPEARADKYGCNGGKQDIVMSHICGTAEAFDNCRSVCVDMMAPVEHCYVMTPEQMAFLEPTLVEVLGATCLHAMAETLDEACRRGVQREAAISFLSGHIMNLTTTFVGLLGDTQVSDACKVAMKIGERMVLREDWRNIWDDGVLKRVIATMLHPDEPQI